MAFKIQVEDRIPTYPGRVTLTPVAGSENTFDMVRADLPLVEGTPINKTLFDSKTDSLVENVIVYVASNGSDIDGDGNSDAPFATIQKAIDALPKNLNGHTAEISVGFGVYDERLSVVGFGGGRLKIGRPGDVFTIKGIDVVNSSFIETNIYQIEDSITGSKALFDVSGGSNVLVNSDMIIDGLTQSATAMRAIDNSIISIESARTLTVNNCGAAINAQKCSFVTVDKLTGSDNTFGMMAYMGSIISYNTDTLDKAWSNDANSGGLVLTGTNSSDLSGATIEL